MSEPMHRWDACVRDRRQRGELLAEIADALQHGQGLPPMRVVELLALCQPMVPRDEDPKSIEMLNALIAAARDLRDQVLCEVLG